MSNELVGNIWHVDTAASILTDKPICVKKVIMEPNAVSDAAVFNFWDISQPATEGAGKYSYDAITGTITLTTTLTMASGTLLPSTVRDGDIFYITGGNGANTGTKSVVTTAGNNTVIVSSTAGWTNEAGKTYHFTTYPYYRAFKLIVPGTDLVEVQLDFGDKGHWFPNLVIESLSTSVVCRVYIK